MTTVAATTGPRLTTDLMNLVGMHPPAPPLSMGWCLECHRNPAPNRRPVSEVTNMKWTPPRDLRLLTAQLGGRPVNPPTQCSGCHR